MHKSVEKWGEMRSYRIKGREKLGQHWGPDGKMHAELEEQHRGASRWYFAHVMLSERHASNGWHIGMDQREIYSCHGGRYSGKKKRELVHLTK